MREFLTFISGLLVLILSVALVGPHFVDWNAQRARIEALLSEHSGLQVAVGGSINVTLLPTPRVELENVEVGSPAPGEPRLGLGRASVELNLSPLLRGTLALGDVTLEEPILRLTLGADGSFSVPALPRPARTDVAFDHLMIRQGHLSLEDPARNRVIVLDGIDLDAQGDSLTGPFKATGSLQLPIGAAAVFRLSTAALESGRLRSKLVLDLSTGLRSELDGAFVFAAGTSEAERISFDGGLVLSSTFISADVKLPWRLTGPLTLDAFGAAMDTLDLRLGDEDHALSLNGRARLAFSAVPSGEIELNARQLDLDRLLAVKKSTGPAINDAPLKLAQMLEDALAGTSQAHAVSGLRTSVHGSLKVASPLVILGGETLADARLLWSQNIGSPAKLDFEVTGPGATRLAAAGQFSPARVAAGTAPEFQGTASLATRDLVRWRSWLSQALPQTAQRLAFVPFRAFDAAGDVKVSATHVELSHMTLTSDRSSLVGDVSYASATGSMRARLSTHLSCDALDLDALPDLTDVDKAIPDVDVSLSLDARAIRVANASALRGNELIDVGHINLDVSTDATGWKLDRLAIADLGGASLTARGSAANGVAALDGQLEASSLTELANMLRRLAPLATTSNSSSISWQGLAHMFAQRAAVLVPAKLDLHAKAQRQAPKPWSLSDVSLSGTVGGTRIQGRGTPDATAPGDATLSLTLDSPETPVLLRQVGASALALTGLGPAHVNMLVRGNAAQPAQTRIEARLAGSDFDFDGTSSIAEAPVVTGSLRLNTPDVSPLLQALAVILPDGTAQKMPAALSAQVRAKGGDIALNDLAGSLAGSSMTGDLNLAPAPNGARAKLSGALRFDQLSLPALLALNLGAPTAPKPGATWSDAAFGVGLADAPDTSLQLSSRSIVLMEGWSGQTARLQLDLAPGDMRISGLSTQIASGTLGGRLQLRRDRGSALLSANFNLEGIALNGPDATGRISGQIEATASAANAQALVGNLAGAGRLTIAYLTINHASPQALSKLVASPEAASLSVDASVLVQQLSTDLDKAPLKVGSRIFDLGLAGGVIRLAPTGPQSSTDDLQIRLGASLDLRNQTLDAEARLSLAKAPKDWGDSPLPQVRLNWLGPWTAPKRTLDARTLMSGLTGRALVLETARIDALEADARERAFFVRRLRGLQFMKQRERELATYTAEQAALAERLAAAERDRARRAPAPGQAPPASPLPPAPRAADPSQPQTIIPWPVR